MTLRLVQRVAVGGMAELFLAHRLDASGAYARTVVVKTVRSDEADPERARAALRDEARVGGALRHPGIVRLLDADVGSEAPHLELEFVFGRDLSQLRQRCRARGTPVPAPHVRTIIADLLEALDYAHFEARLGGQRLELVHRDVSPHNVLVGFDGRTRLLDFGLAVGRHRGPSSPSPAGKAAYAAPEQMRGGRVDHRSDLFSAGIASWELLADADLFGGRSRDLNARRAPWPRCAGRPVPWDLGWWTWRALRTRPMARPGRGGTWAAAWRRRDPRTPERARAELSQWMQELYAGPLARRARAAASEPHPERARQVLDAGFELLPRGATTVDLET